MSRLILAGAFALAAAIVAPQARAENPFGLEVPGWSSRQAQTGTVYFSCERESCGGSEAVISISRRNRAQDLTLEKFQETQALINANILKYGARSSTLGPAMVADATQKPVKIFTMPRDVVDKEGQARFYHNALLVGPAASLSVVSEGGTRKVATDNFRLLLPRLIDLALALR